MQRVKINKTAYFFVLWLALMALSSCDNDAAQASTPLTDTTRLTIRIIGNVVDTAFLYAPYSDRGVALNKFINGRIRCVESDIPVKTTNDINNKVPGVYHIVYSAIDANGDTATATRTVHMVQSPFSDVFGSYRVNYNCSVTQGSSQPTVTAGTYTSVVEPGEQKNDLVLGLLNIGPEKIRANSRINNGNIEVSFFSPDYHYASSGSGTLSPANTSFTVESTVYAYSHKLVYHCTNIFKRELVHSASR